MYHLFVPTVHYQTYQTDLLSSDKRMHVLKCSAEVFCLGDKLVKGSHAPHTQSLRRNSFSNLYSFWHGCSKLASLQTCWILDVLAAPLVCLEFL